MKYLQKDQFEIVKKAPPAEFYFPRLGPGEVVVLDADTGAHHAYIQCRTQDEARAAVEETLFTTVSQVFYVVRLR